MLSSIVSFARASCALGLLALGLAAPSYAVAPKAPSKPVVTSTLNFKQGDTNITGTARAYRLRWEDNSLDETGFKIEVRFGNTGPFLYVDTVGPNVTEYTLAYDFLKDTLAQFRVVAFKYNGSKVESAASPFFEERVAPGVANLTAPSNFRVEAINDGVLKFIWKDRSTNELYYQIMYKKAAAAESTYATLNALASFDDKEAGTAATEVFMLHGLIPGESYNFVIRATRKTTGVYSTTGTAEETAVVAVSTYPVVTDNKYTVPKLTPPSDLSGEPISVDTVELRWKDNSYNEDHYEIEYRVSGSNGTWSKQSVGSSANTTSYQMLVGPGRTLEYRVRAVPVSDSTLQTEEGDYSDVFTIAMPFDAPEGLTATTSGIAGSVDLEWDDSSEGETAYDIYTRHAGGDSSSSWYYVQSMLADSTRATVSTRFEEDEDVALAMDVEHEFKVVARFAGSAGTVESSDSNYATAYVRQGFTSRSYHPAKVGETFSYDLEVSNEAGRISWAVTGLPDGLSFDAESGKITGVPTAPGVFTPQMTVNFQSYSNTLPLTLRILTAAALPTVAENIANVTVGTGSQFDVDLDGKFADADSEKAVTIKTTKGDIDILLYPSLVPEAVENFMGYVEAGAYNGVMFHRSAVESETNEKFVVQGGGYVPIQSPNYFASLLKRESPRNEPGISNLRGTLAAAKVGGNPDSATHDFFFNMKDNSTTGAALDNQNAGFTVFARVAGSGMSIVDAISNLPRGVYGTSTNNQIILDGYIYSSGSSSPFQETPMDTTAATAPTAMDNNLTVRMTSVKEVPLFKYEVADNTEPEVVRTSFYQGKLRLEGLLPGSSTVTLRAKDLDGNPVEQSFAVTVVKGFKAPAITRHPVSVAALPGKKATLTVTATGTELQYEWRKKTGQTWTAVPGATLKTLTFDAVSEADEGDYQVVVSNGHSALTSNTATVGLRTAPIISLNPVSKVVEAGKPLVLTGAATGAPAPAISWLRSGRAVAGQKLAELNIAAIKVTEGGHYVMRAANAAGRADSEAASVIVVDKASPLVMTLPNKTVVLKAQASGPNLIYRWKVVRSVGGGGQTDVVDDASRIKGSSTATLTIKNFAVDDAGAYTCVVYENNKPETAPETGAYRVHIAGAAPVLTTFTPNVALVGIDYDYTLPFGGSNNSMATAFSIAGLPAGLKMDSVTGRITGKATRSGEYTLKLTAKNPKGSSTLSNIPFYVLPMPEAVVGTFVGQIGASPAINGDKGGRIDMTVSDGGLISGKLSMGKDILSFTGLMTQTVGAVRTTGQATVTRKGGTPLQMVLSSIAPSGYFDSGNVTGTISDGENIVAFSAYRAIYSSAGRRSPYVGRQHLAFYSPETAEDDESTPQGTGYGVVILNETGVMKLTGKLADGTTLTASSFLGGQQQFVIYQSLYKNTGTLVGQAALSYIDTVGPAVNRTNRFRTDGQVNWKRDAQTSATERLYKAGYGPVTLSVLGMTYVTPGDNELIMGLPKIAGSVSSNSSLEFVRGGLEDAAQDPSLEALAIGGSRLVPAGVVNDTATSLSMTNTRTTGLFSGGFNLLDNPALKRTSKYYGLVIPQIPTIPAQTYSDGSSSAAIPGENAAGVGFFTLSQLPEEGPPATTLKNSPILSGKVTLKPVPINITQQPQSQTVDPAESVTFTVVANAQSTITYQWRKNGSNIGNATSSSYTISSAAEASEGSYDVVLKTDYSTVVSDAAELVVNDPVTNVKITRTPAENPVLAGTTVTFSATADGTGPFTYQWYKGSTPTPIDGATGVSYAIESVQTADMASYYVRVFSGITEDGVLSTANELVVAAPITGVVATRTPDTASVSIGGNITFSIPEIQGSAGPYQYQWKKDGQDIEGATAQSYYIEFVRATDIGVYTVLVKNAVTPDGVLSNEVPLQVSTEVGNVNAYRNPSTEFVGLNSPVIFLVSVQGASPFTFQWRKNGEDIPNATLATYSIPSVTEADNGNYSVLVANATTPAGVLSNPVALTVMAPVTEVTISLSPNQTELVVGATLTLTANPNAPGPHSFQWFKDDEVLDGKNEAILHIVSATETDAGNYRVEVSNVVNTSPQASNTVTISVSPGN